MMSNAVIPAACGDWTAACAVQQRFMHVLAPTSDSPDHSGRCRQVCELGGDCYDFLPLPQERLAFAVADASGKGLAAALMIANVQSSLRTAATFAGNDGAAVLEAVNREVHASSLADRFATLFYGVFDRATRRLRYVNAGHNAPLVIRRDGSISYLESGGAPVGMFSDWTYQEQTIQLDAGDLVIAYTDGVVEAVNPTGEEWGVDGLIRAVSECNDSTADEVVAGIFQCLDEFSQGRQTDDSTVAVLRVL